MSSERILDSRHVRLPEVSASTFILLFSLIGTPILHGQSHLSEPAYDFLAHGVQRANVVAKNGVPQLLINGQPVPPLMFFFNLEAPPDHLRFLQPQVQAAAASGIHLYSTTFDSWPWDSNGSPDYSAADRQMDLFLKVDRNAVFLLRIDVSPPVSWTKWKEIDKRNDIWFSDGSRSPISIASDFYFQAFLRNLRSMIRHYEASIYAPHIAGYDVTAQESEWFPKNYRTKGLDYSPVNTEAFRDWLKIRYPADADLAKAWRRKVTLAVAPMPIPKKGRFPIHGSRPSDRVEAFYQQPKEQDWIDYSLYISEIISQRILDVAHVIRMETRGNRLIVFFQGYIFDLPGSMSGHLNMGRLLASPDIDIFSAPISYRDRAAGGAGGAMTALDSIAAHGKLWINEDDMRTYLDDGTEPNLRPATDFEDTSDLLQRNLSSELVHRAGTWWMDLKAVGAFNDPRLWGIMSKFGLPLYNQLYSSPQPYRPEVAVIVDEYSGAFQKSDWDVVAQTRNSLRNNLAKSGAAVGYYYLDDFLKGKLPQCRVYVFANAFYLANEQIAKIRGRLESEGATAIWQYAPGFLGPSGADITRSKALTGIDLKATVGRMTSDGEGLLRGQRWGWTGHRRLSPRLVVLDREATVLGRYLSDRRVSTAIKRVGPFQSIFVGDVVQSVEVLRTLLRQAGVHIWTSNGDVVNTDGKLFVIHSSSPGSRLIRIPAGTSITTLGGDVLATGPDALRLSFSRTGETTWFRLRHT